ncbi:MAG: tRNA (adenosine(37)-N6)-threonylcarbamoyltransferase complex dimerization subunit type 1 TsaB [Candidatus Buchananbacteria bacterium RIFCSPHIGHO2_02_FULL_39_17]|nr:MAG: tRNA (adenosine(37)-N6)-threonylcarbamoyltransferase complex dimerization subunit type 1 TsaB [Candidatus Buchananbacteria bacterium RIFCSPHIGHO2_02_FULL_39_17]
MILIINTADEKKVFLGLINKGELMVKKDFLAQYRQAEKLLIEINNLLKAKSYQLKTLTAIAVIAGPGPFTAIRIGIITANTFGWALKIPVIGITLIEFKNEDNLIQVINKKIKQAKTGDVVEPFYGQEPSIRIKDLN